MTAMQPRPGDIVETREGQESHFSKVLEVTDTTFVVQLRGGDVKTYQMSQWRSSTRLAPNGLAAQSLAGTEVSPGLANAGDLIRWVLLDLGDGVDGARIRQHLTKVTGDADLVERWWKRKTTRVAIRESKHIRRSGKNYSLIREASPPDEERKCTTGTEPPCIRASEISKKRDEPSRQEAQVVAPETQRQNGATATGPTWLSNLPRLSQPTAEEVRRVFADAATVQHARQLNDDDIVRALELARNADVPNKHTAPVHPHVCGEC